MSSTASSHYRLSADEVEKCREAFLKFDKDGNGAIDIWELREILRTLNNEPTEEELIAMVEQADEDGSGSIEFGEFLELIASQKVASRAHKDDDSDTLESFVALGGNHDKSGHIDPELLADAVKAYGLNVDLTKFMVEVDTDVSGFIDHDEWKAFTLGTE
jgi:Ca2+-binding EF-hand superfamily protein